MASLKVKVSNPMVKFIKDAVKDLKCVDDVRLCKCSENHYYMNVCSRYSANEVDYDWDNDEWKYIQVDYTPECYAMPTCITTDWLTRLFNSITDKTAESFKMAIAERVEI